MYIHYVPYMVVGTTGDSNMVTSPEKCIIYEANTYCDIRLRAICWNRCTNRIYFDKCEIVMQKDKKRFILVWVFWKYFKERQGLESWPLKQKMSRVFQAGIVSRNRNVPSKLGDRERNWLRLQNRKKWRDTEWRKPFVCCFISCHCKPIRHVAFVGDHTQEGSRNSSWKGPEPSDERWKQWASCCIFLAAN